MNKKASSVLSFTVLVASLGYFVDIYDLLLFPIIRVKSLSAMGLSGNQLLVVGAQLLNIQMIGLLAGGILWGILGDKRGRISVLFGSILLYSLGNIGNGMIGGEHVILWYKVFRLISGLGLAGELGAGITLVSEMLPRNRRGYGTAIVASVGVSGAVVAFLVSRLVPDWRISFFVGGGLGLLLLILRISVLESGMYDSIRKQAVAKGNFLSFFTNRERFSRYLKCILLGLPTWYVAGILIAFSDTFARSLGVRGKVDPGNSVMIGYAVLSVGGLVSGWLSEWIHSRKKVLYVFYFLTLICVFWYFDSYGVSVTGFYVVCGALGFSVGFWAVFVTVAAEQFGTNLRATSAITVPNFARGALPLITMVAQFLEDQVFHSYLEGALWTGVLCIGIAFTASVMLPETYGKDLDYLEKA